MALLHIDPLGSELQLRFRGNAPAQITGVSAVTNQEATNPRCRRVRCFDNVRGRTERSRHLYRIWAILAGSTEGTNERSRTRAHNQEIHSRTRRISKHEPNFDGVSQVKTKCAARAQIASRSDYYAIPPEEIVLLSPADRNVRNFSAIEGTRLSRCCS